MQQRVTEIDTEIMEATPNAHRILRSSLLHAVIEAMSQRDLERLAAKAPKPQNAPHPGNRHERRSAQALARRGR